MAPKEPTRAQLSSRLAYNSHTPSFLLKLQNKIAGVQDEEEGDDDPEFEYVGDGREPIPRRPTIPERPADDPGSADEEEGDEKPMVVVLREGKHLTEREAENIKRKEKGLPPLPTADEIASKLKGPSPSESKGEPNAKKAPQKQKPALSFSTSSSSKPNPKSSTGKRKSVVQPEDEEGDEERSKSDKKNPPKKKAKKERKTLLSFGDDT